MSKWKAIWRIFIMGFRGGMRDCLHPVLLFIRWLRNRQW